MSTTGTVGYAGTYLLAGIYNGQNYYRFDATHYLWYNGSAWCLSSGLGAVPPPYYVFSSASVPPRNGWTNTSGSSPFPTVTFPSVDAATSVDVQRALDSAFTSSLVTFANVAPSTTYVDSTVVGGTTYYYRYDEVNSGGSAPGPYSSLITGMPTITKGGAAVIVPVTTAGAGPGNTQVFTLGVVQIVDANGVVVLATAGPSGAVTVNDITITKLSQTTTVEGNNFALYSLQIAADAPIAAGMGYALEEVMSVPPFGKAFGLFDVVSGGQENSAPSITGIFSITGIQSITF
ncbi:hypothetical protein [Capsulimonas corticalis]|uniref:hypothetical protein n=1 Tax=Capsulimonas corticalis TaxID=2219043 RepID=UPI000F64564D|nr:hypothetical protein [Capsulimonas corticalis]